MKKYFNLTTYVVFGVFSVLTTFYFPYLNQHVGLSLAEVGTVVSIGALFTLIAQPVLSNQFSKVKNRNRFILIYLAFVFLAIIGLIFINKDWAIIFAPIYGGVLAPVAGIFEIYIEDLCVKKGFEFSDIRKWGSIGYGCIVLLGGGIIAKFGYRILHILALSMIILIALVIIFKFENTEIKVEQLSKVGFKDLIKNKTVVLLSIIVFLSIGSYAGVDFAYSSYLVDITKDVSLANKIYSGSIGFRVFIEFISFMLVSKYLSKANSKKCIMIAFSIASIKILLFSTGILPLIVLGDQLHGIMYGLYLTFIFKYLREVLDDRIIPSAFAILSVLSSGGANFIYPSIYSLIQEKLGYTFMYLFGFILIISAIVLTYTALPKGKLNNSEELKASSL